MSRIRFLCLPLVLLSLPTVCRAGDDGSTSVRCEDFNGAILLKNGDAWSTVKVGDTVPAGTLMVSLPKAVFRSSNGAVEMRLLADIGQRGPYPVLESAVTINKNPKVDLDVTCDRGIVAFANRKESGAASVSVRFGEHTWHLLLKSPKTRLGLELYSRHHPGLPKLVDGKVPDPMTYIALLVLEGDAFLDTGDADYALHAPPGPARVGWSSVAPTVVVERLEKLPESITKLSNEEEKLFHEICGCVGKLKEREAGPLLDVFLASDSKVDRLVGVTVMGAIDDLPRLLGALADPKHMDVREHAILVLRHWMGRGPGQAGKLLAALKESAKYNNIQALTIMQLLFGFNQHDRFDPATYELLTAYLGHSQVAVRELAHWHLVRLMPEGKTIVYDAGAAEAQRQAGVQAWRELVAKHH